MDAQGALDSLLGRLTTVLVNEAQLLGRVRGDVEFIKDEMESMNGLILHLTEAQYRDHQVRAWMKQVVGLTRDCEGNVELYVHYVGSRPGDNGLLGYLRQIRRFLRTIPVRHRIATRIKELKVRARDVGDRWHRYGVTVPESTRADLSAVDVEPSEGHEDFRRRAVLLDPAEPPQTEEKVLTRVFNTLVECLKMEPAATQDGPPLPQVRVFCILGRDMADTVAFRMHQEHSSVASIFGCKVWSYGEDVGTVLDSILEQVGGAQLQPGQEEDEVTRDQAETWADEDREKQVISKIQGHLKGKRFMIIVQVHFVAPRDEWKRLLDALLHAAAGSLPGSAIIMTTDNYDLALSSSPDKIIDAQRTSIMPSDLSVFYMEKVMDVVPHLAFSICFELKTFLHLLYECEPMPSNFALKTFLHLLYVNPNRTEEEVQNYKNSISECRRLKRSISKQVLQWCYNELPSKYRSCLLYLTVFPEGHVIRTTSLARRWVAEGLVTARTSSTTAVGEIRSSTDEAEHCLDVLFIRGFVSPVEIGAAGNIKSFTVHPQVREFIARVATDVNFIDSSLPPHLARYLSIHNRIGLQQSLSDGDDSRNIEAYIPSLSESPQWQLLKVLDLEGCKGLDKKHLKSICKILLLKYLSLRNTDVTELPKQIKELQCLETLDIRQPKLRMLAKKSIVLPLLKHFLAGHNKISGSNGTRAPGESFSAVELPLGIHKMKNMEILSHVKVTNSDTMLTGIAQLLELRKLGVALDGKSTKLSDLSCQIEKLGRCLRSLSIWIEPMAAPDNNGAGTQDALLFLPQFIERLNISGISNGVSSLVQEGHQLTKITLSETQIKDDDLRLLGRLPGLFCLRLQHNTYPDSELVFKEDEFRSLKYLIVKGSSITKISFVEGAAPMLEKMVLYFDRIDCFSGINYLRRLMEVELNGDGFLTS